MSGCKDANADAILGVRMPMPQHGLYEYLLVHQNHAHGGTLLLLLQWFEGQPDSQS